MSAKIYAPPDGYDVPSYDITKNYKENEEIENEYLERMKAWVKERNPVDPEAGELIEFGVADGKAIYMVLGMKPLRLIHLDFMDGYSFEYAHLLNATEVRKLVKQRKAIIELFSRKQHEKR